MAYSLRFWAILGALCLQTTLVWGAGQKDPILVIIQAESSGKPMAVGDSGNSRGICQLSRATWERLSKYPWSDAFDEEKNVQVAGKRIEEIKRKYNTSETAYICYRYNCGDNTKLSFGDWKKRNKNKAYRSTYE